MTDAAAPGPRGSRAGRLLLAICSAWALHDWVLFLYHAVMLALVAAAPRAVASLRGSSMLLASWLALGVAAAIGRMRSSRIPRARSALYRVVLIGTLVASYLMLRDLLPIVQGRALDEELHRFDVALFGVEPSLWAERFATPSVVEYFAFFYFSYFALLAVYSAVTLGLGAAGDATAEFTIGTALVYCIGQLGYVAVPGYGPIVHLKDSFAAPLEGGFFWRSVVTTVSSGGALRDIFPSLHTAVPIWFTVFALGRARLDRRWRAGAWATAFFTVNIVLSTVVLRWHYLVDVVAGLLLSAIVAWAAPRAARWEAGFRSRKGLVPVWLESSPLAK